MHRRVAAAVTLAHSHTVRAGLRRIAAADLADGQPIAANAPHTGGNA
jgi:hypothetical protein